MSLAAGSKLGPYEILAQIGKGGMGEVYKAHDSRLRRDVAIKVSAEKFSERFDREARAVAALNHPNICTLYDVGPNYLVMEFIEGESPKGPLPLDEALRIAASIADALEAAHEKGITHRDLKPGNIMIRSDGSVKVLDFGLAQHIPQHSSDTDVANSPTLTMGMTAAGAILGTAAYMAPEQARGKKLDKRADIWAFGVVLYELITGQRLFQGEDVVEILAAVVHGKPDLSAEQIPPNVRRVLERCLEKDPRKRLHDISGVALLLEGGTEVPRGLEARPAANSSRVPWAVAGVATLAAVAIAFWALWPSPRELKPLTRLDVDLGENVALGAESGADVVISPDGTRLVYASGNRLFTLRLDQSKATPVELAGTASVRQPFFMPDGKWVGFFSSALFKIAVDGGSPIRLASSTSARGGSWGEDGSIIAALNSSSPLVRIPTEGGAPEPLGELGPGENSHRWPQILPGGQAVLFTAGSGSFDTATINVFSFKDKSRKTLQRGASYGRYVAASDGSGYLTYVNRGTLFAVPFDLERLETRGTGVPVMNEVGYNASNGGALMDFSRSGTLVYRGGFGSGNRVVQFMDPAGKTEMFLVRPDTYMYPRMSPDGQRLSIVAAEGGSQDVWVYDVKGGRSSRLTIGLGATLAPIWTPDGRYILYQAPGGIFWTRSDGGSKPQPLLQSKNTLYAWSVSQDGKRLAYSDVSPETGYDLWTVPIETNAGGLKAGTPEKFLVTPKDERHPAFSPDGHWIAYASDESGQFEIYVRAFPDTGGRFTVSSKGGHYPVFSKNGRDLFYRTEDGQVMVTRYRVNGDSFVSDPPRPFSEKRLYNLPGNGSYDIVGDGQSIVGLFPAETAGAERSQSHVTFLMNFADEIRRRVGTGR